MMGKIFIDRGRQRLTVKYKKVNVINRAEIDNAPACRDQEII